VGGDVEQTSQGPDVIRGEIGGVTSFYHEAPPPYVAALVFRVGRADETLPSAGITHIVEHMALTGLGEVPYAFDGATGIATTMFTSSGTALEVKEFFRRIAGLLADLPLERMAAELEILRTESESREPSPIEALLSFRYGARGYGLIGFDELGFRTVTDAQVAEWARHWFCASNAAVWISGPEPLDLELPMPAGRRVPPPPVRPLRRKLPSWVAVRQGLIAASFPVRRSAAVPVLASLLQTRATRVLRHTLSVSYDVTVVSVPLNAEIAELVVWADCLPRNAVTVHENLRRVLDELAEGGPTTAELEAERKAANVWWGTPDEVRGLLEDNAVDELMGAPTWSLQGLLAELAEIGPGDVAGVLGEVLPNGMYMVPGDVELRDSSLAPLDALDSIPVKGRRLWPADKAGLPLGTHLVVGERGVSLLPSGPFTLPRPPTDAVTIAFDDCVALLRSPNGGRELISFDGSSLDLDPQTFKGLQEVLPLIDSSVPAARHVDVDVSPDQPSGGKQLNWRGGVAGMVFIASLLIMLLVLELNDSAPPFKHPAGAGGVLFFSGSALALACFVVSLWRWGRWSAGEW
jgi:zinc protease